MSKQRSNLRFKEMSVADAKRLLAETGQTLQRAPHDYGWLVYDIGDPGGIYERYVESPGEAIRRYQDHPMNKRLKVSFKYLKKVSPAEERWARGKTKTNNSSKRWMQKAFATHKKGSLHRYLKVSLKQKIPISRLQSAERRLAREHANAAKGSKRRAKLLSRLREVRLALFAIGRSRKNR